MLREGGSVKITRAEVRTLTVAGLLALCSNHALRSLVDRVRARRFVLFAVSA
jgi:farnesyl-diphosphate farnesyltransferase